MNSAFFAMPISPNVKMNELSAADYIYTIHCGLCNLAEMPRKSQCSSAASMSLWNEVAWV